VLDGLERVQADTGVGRVRGELEDHTLKLLLQAIAAGLGRTRALVTSRFPLTDLRDWRHRGVVDTVLEDLTPEAARQVLRGWGVKGDDAQLDEVCTKVGRHALSVAVIGSYLGHFEAGNIVAADALTLDAAAGEDPKAAKLARVLAYYAERLPPEERELLARLSVFPRGITLDVLGTLIDAGGQVAGVLVNAKPAVARLLARLVDRGLAFRYPATDGTLTWTAHPFVRECFAGMLGCPAEAVFDAVASRLGQGLEQRPEQKPEDTATLDRYEQLIEATRLAGRVQEAFDLYWHGLGSYLHLGKRLGDYARGYRILCGFLPPFGDPKNFGAGLTARRQSLGLNALGLWAHHLGRLRESADIRREDNARKRVLDEPLQTSIGLRNACQLAIDLGRLGEAFAAAREAFLEAERAQDDLERRSSLAHRAATQHLMGDVGAARVDFSAITTPESEAMPGAFSGREHARHQLDLGNLGACRAITEAGFLLAERYEQNAELPGWHALFARFALAEGQDPNWHIHEIRVLTARSGAMEWILEAHDLAARAALVRGDLAGARAEADDGLRQARLCGYRLRLIELLAKSSAIDLAWPDAGRAFAGAREALNLATAPECGYAWGEADAAHACGLAIEALGQREHAQRAFAQALAVRERIEHPGVAETRAALARLA
jgi:tetratricopeptide (TPR) repeat protein